jgi:hypothetical protein
MENKAEVIKRLHQIRNMHAAFGEDFNGDYEWGFYNGIEIALSFIENRPAFYLGKDGKYNKYDIKRYPEYFV